MEGGAALGDHLVEVLKVMIVCVCVYVIHLTVPSIESNLNDKAAANA